MNWIGPAILGFIGYVFIAFLYWALVGACGGFRDDVSEEISIAKVVFWPITIPSFLVALTIRLIWEFIKFLGRAVKGLGMFFKYNVWDILRCDL